MSEKQSFRDSIATVDKDGKRQWVFAKKVSGKYFNKRQVFSYSLLALLFIGPFISIGGEPLLMLNIIERKFVIFGQIFWPEDAQIFAIGLIAFVILVIVFTVVFGRLFCGWACPQTIFLELIFRRIEFWIDGDWNQQKKLDKLPWKRKKITKRLIKWSIFWVISFIISNTFLAYVVGKDELFKIITSPPSEHLGGLVTLIIFTTVFFSVFTWFREQVCIAVCPYGRLQGVLLDENSVLVAYDYKRGEREKGRAKFKKGQDRAKEEIGDCIDCRQCINVCPTGIDIRNGTQLECVNCTACMDACDFMMESTGLEKGLIRYDSEKGIKNGVDFKLSGRAKAYIILMVAILALLVTLIVTREDVEATILRVRGTSYQKIDKNTISNLYTVTLINKSSEDLPITIKGIGNEVKVENVGTKKIVLLTGEQKQQEIIVKMNPKDISGPKTPIKIGIFSDNKLVDEVHLDFSGPGF